MCKPLGGPGVSTEGTLAGVCCEQPPLGEPHMRRVPEGYEGALGNTELGAETLSCFRHQFPSA